MPVCPSQVAKEPEGPGRIGAGGVGGDHVAGGEGVEQIGVTGVVVVPSVGRSPIAVVSERKCCSMVADTKAVPRWVDEDRPICRRGGCETCRALVR